MGQCVICGNETKNQYKCYSADVVGQSSTLRGVKTTYNNFETHQEFVCNGCIAGKKTIRMTIIISAILLPISIGLLISGLSSQEYMAALLGGLLLIYPIYSIPSSIRNRNKHQTDDGLYKEYYPLHNGEDTLIGYLTRQRNPHYNPQDKRVFFDAEQYEQLKPKL